MFATTNASSPSLGEPDFFNMDNGLNTIEFYAGDISGNFGFASNLSALGGAQDNAPSVVGFSGYPTGPAQWQMTVGGDGFDAAIDPVGTGSSLRYFVGNNSGRISRCVSNCLAGGAGYTLVGIPGAATQGRLSSRSTCSTVAFRAATTALPREPPAAAATSSTARLVSGRRSTAATAR